MLRSFATSGRPPARSALAEIAGRYGTTAGAVLAALHAADFLRLGSDGGIHAAYPFSAVPAPDVVDIASGPRVHAMCAVDALGIAAMLGTGVIIASADPCTGETVTTRRDDRRMEADLGSCLLRGTLFRRAVQCSGRLAGSTGRRSGMLWVYELFTTRAGASPWAHAHPEVIGQILGQSTALRLGKGIFGHLLSDG